MNLECGRALAQSLGFKLHGHRFGATSLRNSDGVYPPLRDVAALGIDLSPVDGSVLSTGGVRTREQAIALGFEDSRHRVYDGWGRALDVVIYPLDWKDAARFRTLAENMKIAAAIMELPTRQGADWNMNGKFQEVGTKEWDWPHIEHPHSGHMPQAVKEMNRVRALLGLAPVNS